MKSRDRRCAFRVGAPALVACVLGACAPESVPVTQPGDPLPGLEDRELGRFLLGRAVFEREATPDEGLGPLYNEVRCSGCHDTPVIGGAGFTTLVTKATRWENGRCDPLMDAGGDNIQQRATPMLARHGILREEIPARANAQATVTAPALFGLGLIERIPDAAIASRADPDDGDGDGISGRVAWAGSAAGRIGRKGELVTVADFIDTALRFELGLTTPMHRVEETVNGRPLPEGVDPLPEPEIEQNGIELLTDFVRFLAPPPGAAPASPAHADTVRRGEGLFGETGCSACHTPELRTDRTALAALDRKPVRLYSDLLLHDMGPGLADVCGGEASPAEWMTAKLWGLRYRTRLMHDGRATDMEQAIALHDGEAASAKAAFAALTATDRAALLRFLESL